MYEKWPSFDQLVRLAQKDPAKFEKFRKQQVDSLIDSLPEASQRRLRGLQFQIDCRRQLQKSPMASCVEISKMMRDALNQLNAALNGRTIQRKKTATTAGQVLKFPAANC